MELTVAAVQIDGTPGNREERLARIAPRVAEAAARGAKLAVLPEVALAGYAYDPRNFAAAEPVPGPATAALAELARRHDMVIAAGLVERDGSDCYDTMVVVGPEGYLGRYRKVHVASAENAYWKPGKQGAVIATRVGRIGLGICADMTCRTPWRWYRNDAVDILAIGSGWPDLGRARPRLVSARTATVHAAWVRALPEKISRALALPVVYANLGGQLETRLPFIGLPLRAPFAGGSKVVAEGITVTEMSGNEEGLAVARVELGGTRPQLGCWSGPWLPEARPWDRLVLAGGDRVTGALYRLAYLASRRRATSGLPG